MDKKNIFKLIAFAGIALILFVGVVYINSSLNTDFTVLKKLHKVETTKKAMGPQIPKPEERPQVKKIEELKSPRFSQRMVRYYRSHIKHSQDLPDDDITDGEIDEDSDIGDGEDDFIETEYVKKEWKEWKKSCGKHYKSKDEEKDREAEWKKHYIEMEKEAESSGSFARTETCDMDKTNKDFMKKKGGLDISEAEEDAEDSTDEEITDDDDDDELDLSKGFSTRRMNHYFQRKAFQPVEHKTVYDQVDWRGVITLPVRQQKCGDCWANAGIAAVEACNQIGGDKYEKFAVQEMVDCIYPNGGCEGGFYDKVYSYVVSHGIIPEEDEPYIGKFESGDKCYNGAEYKTDADKSVSGQEWAKNCNDLKAAVSKGPVAVAIDANNDFKQAGSGMVPLSSRAGSITHAVIVVGYTADYWIIQNSWGETMGFNGYWKLQMGNTIHVCEYGLYPKPTNGIKLTPKTSGVDFFKIDGQNGGSGGSSDGAVDKVNLNSLLGSKFEVYWSWSGNSGAVNNKAGQRLSGISEYYYYVPNGREKTDFNYLKLSLEVIDDASGSIFEFLFQESSGLLQTTNVNGDTFSLGQCETNSGSGGPLEGACDGFDKTYFYLWSSTFTYMLHQV